MVLKTWNQLFVRHGWNLEQVGDSRFLCKQESEENIAFLLDVLNELKADYKYESGTLHINSAPVQESEWIRIIDFEFRGKTELIGLAKETLGPKLVQLDTYISGIVRQLNRLGFYTTASCDGHEKRPAYVYVTKETEIDSLLHVLLGSGLQRVYYIDRKTHYCVRLPFSRKCLLDLAEKMSYIQTDWVEEGYDFIKEQLFYVRLDEMLSIPGVSENEDLIRNVVKEKLTPFVDNIAVDRYGNLLAEKTYGTGNGAVLLLNAHLDIASELVLGREIIKEDGIWRSSEGILGADDRAGIAAILEVASTMSGAKFNGKIKFIFTVEEEIGLLGAQKVDEYFLWGVDAAFVIDRRGTGDIVTSAWGGIPFCDVKFGELIEQIANDAELEGWACTEGGSSDTRIWAEHGIECVNLSAGYYNEHTDEEYLDVAACYNVTKLLMAIIKRAGEVKRLSRTIRTRQMIGGSRVMGRKSV